MNTRKLQGRTTRESLPNVDCLPGHPGRPPRNQDPSKNKGRSDTRQCLDGPYYYYVGIRGRVYKAMLRTASKQKHVAL